MDCAEVGQGLQNHLGLERQAVAITFLAEPPAGVPRVKAPQPASCSYWKMASDGAVFFTTAEDHLNCVIGAYTHGVSLSPEKGAELQATLGQMFALNYVRQPEVAQIPVNKDQFQVAVYSPLALSPCDPQVVIVRGNARHLMLLTEAAAAAGIPCDEPKTRPTCAFIPATIQTGHANTSFACIGNRVYTEMEADELYFAIPGSRVAELVEQLETILSANHALEGFHQARTQALGSSAA
jgi:uncharacterized protein (DUF169 family)